MGRVNRSTTQVPIQMRICIISCIVLLILSAPIFGEEVSNNTVEISNISCVEATGTTIIIHRGGDFVLDVELLTRGQGGKYFITVDFKSSNAFMPDEIGTKEYPIAVDLVTNNLSKKSIKVCATLFAAKGEYNGLISVWNNYNNSSNKYSGLCAKGNIQYRLLIVERFDLQDPHNIRQYDNLNIFINIDKYNRNNLKDLTINNQKPLLNVKTKLPLTNKHKNITILIHGWRGRAFGSTDPYSKDEWANLCDELEKKHPSDWALVKYDWRYDADTGFIIKDIEYDNRNSSWSYIKDRQETYAVVAAERAYQHGLIIAKKLFDQVGESSIEKVHIIAHSAGSWAALAALASISARAKGSQIQVTYLDPFIPSRTILYKNHFLSESQIEMSKNYARVNGKNYMKCEILYYADTGVLDTEGGHSKPSSVDFTWENEEQCRVMCINNIPTSLTTKYQIPSGTIDTNATSIPELVRFSIYEWGGHGGPINYYADSIRAYSGGIVMITGWDKAIENISPATQGLDHIIFVLDTSGSMGGSKIQKLIETSSRLIESLYDGINITVVAFQSDASSVVPMVSLSSANRNSVIQTLSSLVAGGGTNYQGAFEHVCKLCDNNYNTTIAFLSDGQPNEYNRSMIEYYVINRIPIFTIGYDTDINAERILREIASDTGGTYASCDSSALMQMFRQIIAAGTKMCQVLNANGYFKNVGEKHEYRINVPEVFVEEAIIAFNLMFPGSDISIELLDPNGRLIKSDFNDSLVTFSKSAIGNDKSFVIQKPLPGIWKVILAALDIPLQGEPYTVQASHNMLKTPVIVSSSNSSYELYEVPEICIYAPKAEIDVQNSTYIIHGPGNTRQEGSISLWNKNDLGDGRANYSYKMPSLEKPGLYRVTALLNGSVDGQRFAQEFILAFPVRDESNSYSADYFPMDKSSSNVLVWFIVIFIALYYVVAVIALVIIYSIKKRKVARSNTYYVSIASPSS